MITPEYAESSLAAAGGARGSLELDAVVLETADNSEVERQQEAAPGEMHRRVSRERERAGGTENHKHGTVRLDALFYLGCTFQRVPRSVCA